MPPQIYIDPLSTERAGERVQVYIPQGWWYGTGLRDVIPQTGRAWDQDVPVLVSGETRRAEQALLGHLAMIESLSGWQSVPADHTHPQLHSEPDD